MLTKLKNLNRSGTFASGNPRWYYRPKGQKGVAMPDLPMNPPEFLAEYAKVAGVKPRAPVLSGSLGAAIQLYLASDNFAFLAVTTRAQRRPILDTIREKYGHAIREGLAAKHIAKDLEAFSGNVRNHRLKVWRGFCEWLTDHYHMSANPSDGLKRAKVANSKGHNPWTEQEIQKFRDYWPHGTMQRLAFELIFWTGARVSDAIKLGPGSVDKDGWLTFTQQKTGGKVHVPFARDLPEFADPFADDLNMLHQAINARNERHMTFLHTTRGASRSSKSVSQWFAAQTRKAGIMGRTAHGLRKSRSESLIEYGATVGQAQAWVGHEDPRMLNLYAKDFDKRRSLTRTEQEQKVPTSTIKFQIEGK